ncbi:Aquaporin-1 [Neofusicoccum ribis]|uniref:Aquaporin-1 n=1 Tax=Neofusicoccum ribis TaxID=45134 RepID=A0ABR3SMG6_9PEZI
MFLTAMLVFTVFMLAAEKHKSTFLAPIGIGLALFVAELSVIMYRFIKSLEYETANPGQDFDENETKAFQPVRDPPSTREDVQRPGAPLVQSDEPATHVALVPTSTNQSHSVTTEPMQHYPADKPHSLGKHNGDVH